MRYHIKGAAKDKQEIPMKKMKFKKKKINRGIRTKEVYVAGAKTERPFARRCFSFAS